MAAVAADIIGAAGTVIGGVIVGMSSAQNQKEIAMSLGRLDITTRARIERDILAANSETARQQIIMQAYVALQQAPLMAEIEQKKLVVIVIAIGGLWYCLEALSL